ncbi:MAG: hypothetical protein H8K06_20755 [Nitrospira sp.]|nr:hypothetical protein [Nitrospira sp.]
MIRRTFLFMAIRGAALVRSAAVVGSPRHLVPADDDYEDGEAQERLIVALSAAKISLQQALTASEQEGEPISARFDIDGGKLLLTVCTTRNERFLEVTVDYTTGKVAQVKQTSGDRNLIAARLQRAAMAKAKISLKEAVDRALSLAAGFRAVSVTPGLEAGHPAAWMLLLNGEEFKTVKQSME